MHANTNLENIITYELIHLHSKLKFKKDNIDNNADKSEKTSVESSSPTVASGSHQQEPQSTNITKEEKICWICFASDEDDRLATWVRPCKCRGTTKYVHKTCLYRWIDEKQKGNALKTVHCQQCQTEYIIIFPRMGKFANILENFDNVVKRLSPFLAAGVVVGSLYWTAVTYGAVTLLQVLGHKQGITFMENGDPLVLLIGLPCIPVGLVLGRMIQWENAILKLIRNRDVIKKIPLSSLIISGDEEQSDNNQNQPNSIQAQIPAFPTQISDPVSATRVFCGALLLPTISSIVGKVLFESIENTLHRTLLGGLVFISVKGFLKIYLKQQQYNRRRKRDIIDFSEENFQKYLNRHSNCPSTNNQPSNNENNV